MSKVLADPIGDGGVNSEAARGKQAVRVGGLLMAAGTARVVTLQHAGDDAAAVLARADQALYRGKAAGRNAVLG